MEVHLVIVRAQKVELQAWLDFHRPELDTHIVEMTRLLRSTWKGNEQMVEQEVEEKLGDKETNEEYVFFSFLLFIVFYYDIFSYNCNIWFNLNVSDSIHLN